MTEENKEKEAVDVTAAEEQIDTEAKDEALPAEQATPTALVPVEPAMPRNEEIEKEAEKLCRWGAARASIIVVAPGLGTIALMANEVYMITRLAKLRQVKLEEGAILGLLSSLGATFVGQTLFTLIPLPLIQVPLGVSVTYGVGKVADAWLREGCPKELGQFKSVFEQAKQEGMSKFKEISNLACKNMPLGDEAHKFDLKNVKANEVFDKIKTHADAAAEKVETAIADVWSELQPLKERSATWLSAQQWENLVHGGVVIPYDEVKAKLGEALAEGNTFTLKDLSYADPAVINLFVEYKQKETLKLVISPEEFTINNQKAYVRLKVTDFDIPDNTFAQMVIKTVGTKLIMSIINAVFKEKVVDNGDCMFTYKDGVLEVYFDQLVQNSKLVKIRVLEKNILDVVQFVALVPMASGVLVKSSFRK